MNELLSEAFRLVNFPFTVLLIIVLLYWLLVAFGIFTGDHGADGAGEIGHDFDGDVSHDVHHDGDLDAEHHVEGYHGHPEGVHWWGAALKFVNLGDVPVTLVLSVLVLAMWMFSVAANYYFTGGSAVLQLGALAVNLIVSVVATRYITLPLKPLFRALRKQADESVEIIGKHCKITTSEANGTFGQAEITTGGAPLLINVRVLNHELLKRGDIAVVVREDKEKRVFYITPNPLPNTDQ